MYFGTSANMKSMQYKNGDTTLLYSVLKAIVIMLTKNQNCVYSVIIALL